MTLNLTEKDYAMLRGDEGAAKKIAMSIIVRMAEISNAENLLSIVGAHIDSTVYIGDAGLEFAEKLASLGAKVAVPTTLNVSGIDEHHWQEWAVSSEWANPAHRQMIAYQSMGTSPTWTCAPYQAPTKPAFGDQIAWGESNAIVFANSVIGARTERYPDLFDICCAITGRAPAMGLHLTENRAGQILFRLLNISTELQKNDVFYPVLGNLIGKLALDKIPVIDGLQIRPTDDQFKAFGAGAASSGGVALFHVVGITPEASTLEDAFHDNEPAQIIDVTMDMLRESRQALNHTNSSKLDMVAVGCPHLSLVEYKKLASLVKGKEKHPDVQFLITSNRAMTQLAQEAGILPLLKDFGVKITVDTCSLTSPMLPPEIKKMMTNSAKHSYYSPGLLGKDVAFGSLEDCVNSAVAGHIIQDESLWKK